MCEGQYIAKKIKDGDDVDCDDDEYRMDGCAEWEALSWSWVWALQEVVHHFDLKAENVFLIWINQNE